jgi:hypothetical protein
MHSPVRSESDVFRGVVIVVAGALLVVLLAAVTDASWAALLAGLLIGAGLALLWMRARGSLPERAEVAERSDDHHRVLVVANETIEGAALLEEIANRCEGRKRSELLLVCPALAGTRLQHLASDIDEGRAEAEGRLQRSLTALRRGGFTAAGIVGDEDPLAATKDALAAFAADEVIISTHPPSRSRWLERGVVEQIRRDVNLPITHVVVDRQAEAGRSEVRAAV